MAQPDTHPYTHASARREFHVAGLPEYPTGGALRWIGAHALRYWWLSAIMIGASVVNNYAFGNSALFIGRGLDVIARPNWPRADLLRVALVIAASATVQGLTGLLRNLVTEILAQRIERDAREELYVSLLGKSQSFHARRRVGDLMARATGDIRALNMMFSPGVMLTLDSALALLVPFAMILILDIRLWLVPTAFLALLVVTVIDYNRRLQPVSVGQRAAYGEMNAQLAEAIGGIEVVKSSVRERYEWDKFSRNARRFRDVFVQQGEVQARYWPMLVFALCWGGALLHGLLLWRSGVLSLGRVVSFMGLFGTFRFATFVSLFSFNMVQMGIAASDRIIELIRQRTPLDRNANGHDAVIAGRVEFRGVTFGFDPAKPVLRDLSFVVEPGQTVAIVGRTGSGKTTLTRLINRMFDVDAGRILIDGVDVRDWNLKRLRGQISVIEQDVVLFSMSVADNIAFGHESADRAAILTAAREAQVDAFVPRFKDGYATEIGERGVMLSGGQKQRIAIARAFLTRPRILILDDSTSAIDSKTEDEIQRAMRRIAASRTTFLITHRLSQIRHADAIVLLQGGAILDHGTHAQLMERCDEYRRIFAHALED